MAPRPSSPSDERTRILVRHGPSGGPRVFCSWHKHAGSPGRPRKPRHAASLRQNFQSEHGHHAPRTSYDLPLAVANEVVVGAAEIERAVENERGAARGDDHADFGGKSRARVRAAAARDDVRIGARRGEMHDAEPGTGRPFEL